MRRRARAANGRALPSCSTLCSAARPAGRPSSSWCGAGTSRISNACTTTRPCAPPTSRSSSRSPRAIASREQFLTDLTLDPPSATSDEAGAPLLDEDYLILSTIHSAKGQEWKSVFVLNAVDGCIPSDLATGNADEIEEERRLLYVAMTRAQGSARRRSCRSASIRTIRRTAATATCTRCARASSRRRSRGCSSSAPGRVAQPSTRPRSRARRST